MERRSSILHEAGKWNKYSAIKQHARTKIPANFLKSIPFEGKGGKEHELAQQWSEEEVISNKDILYLRSRNKTEELVGIIDERMWKVFLKDDREAAKRDMNIF